MSGSESLREARCPECGGDAAHPGIALVGPFDIRGPNGEPCEDAFHDEPESTDCGRTLQTTWRISRWLPGLPWKGWANTWPLGRHWRIDVEWIPAGRSFDFWIYDRRKNDV